jgi:hypothetical protein
MDQGFRRGFTAAEKTELWDRWQRGESLEEARQAQSGRPARMTATGDLHDRTRLEYAREALPLLKQESRECTQG